LVSCTAWAASASSAGPLSRNIDALFSTHELPVACFFFFRLCRVLLPIQ
jgi:hypothetical protein